MSSDPTFKILSLAGVLGLGLAVFILVRDADRQEGREAVPVPRKGVNLTDWDSGEGDTPERDAETSPPTEPGSATKGTSSPSPPPPGSETTYEPSPPSPGPSDEGLAELETELLETRRRVSELEASLAQAVSEIASLKSRVAELEATLQGHPPVVPKKKIPVRAEFVPTGEVVDDSPVFKATRDGYWTALGLDTSAHPEIYSYRIKWFNGKWSPWYFPGIEDVDHKTNSDGSQRRMWSYFTDHEFQVIYR